MDTIPPTLRNRARDKGRELTESQKIRMEEVKAIRLKPGILRALRLDAQYTQSEVAEACGFDREEHVRKYEGPNQRGESTEPFRAFERIARLMLLSGVTDIREILVNAGETDAE